MEWLFNLLEEYWWVVAIVLACIGWFVFSVFFGESNDDDDPGNPCKVTGGSGCM